MSREISENSLPLSFAQQRLWFLNELDPGNRSYNLPRVIRIVGTLDVDALSAAIQSLVTRHEGIRTVFSAVDGEPRQAILPTLAVPLSLIELEDSPTGERKNEALRAAGE